MAAQARTHRLGFAAIRLLENLGIGQQRTRDVARICRPACDDVLGFVDVGDASDDGNGNGDVLAFLDLAGKLAVETMGLIVRRHGEELRAPIDDEPGRDVDHVEIFLRELEKLDDLLDPHATIDHLVTADAHVEHEIVADGFAHGLEQHEREPAAVLEAAAEVVVAMIGERRQKSGNQVTVGSVDVYAVELGLLQPHRAVNVVRDDVLHVAELHLLEIGVLPGDGQRRGCKTVLALDKLGMHATTGMDELDRNLGTMAMSDLG